MDIFHSECETNLEFQFRKNNVTFPCLIGIYNNNGSNNVT